MEVYFFGVSVFFMAASLLLLADGLLQKSTVNLTQAQGFLNLWAAVEAFHAAGTVNVGNEMWGTFFLVLALDLAYFAYFLIIEPTPPRRKAAAENG